MGPTHPSTRKAGPTAAIRNFGDKRVWRLTDWAASAGCGLNHSVRGIYNISSLPYNYTSVKFCLLSLWRYVMPSTTWICTRIKGHWQVMSESIWITRILCKVLTVSAGIGIDTPLERYWYLLPAPRKYMEVHWEVGGLFSIRYNSTTSE
jgi:hypothetical protein